MDIYKLRFPVGEWEAREPESAVELEQWISDIESFPTQIESYLSSANEINIDHKYRPDGWSVRQVVHHCADSHMNSIIRFKLALTEDRPEIRPYHEARWAELSDTLQLDVEASIQILKGVHARWVTLLKNLSDDDLRREFVHPEHGTAFTLSASIGMYAWHCRHHLAHVKIGLESEGKYN